MGLGPDTSRSAALLFLQKIFAMLDLIARSPRHDRHSRGGVLRRAFNETVGIDHVDEHIALAVTAAHDLHLFEK